jgi:Ca2+/H+ antiporter
MISDGSELLLLIPSVAGLVGSVVLPVLGAVPDGAIVLFSGVGPDAQEQLTIGIGALAGSTIMLLTAPWFLSVFGGRVNVVGGKAVYKQPKLNPPGTFSWTETGVNLSENVNTGGYLMMITSIPFLIIQIPASFDYGGSQSVVGVEETPYAFVAMLSSVAMFFGYLYYQYALDAESMTAEVRIERIQEKIADGHITLRQVILAELHHQHMDKNVLSKEERTKLLTKGTKVHSDMEAIIKPFFKKFDKDGNSSLSLFELGTVMKELGEQPGGNNLKTIFDSFDANKNGKIDYDEFVNGITSYIADNSVSSNPPSPQRDTEAAVEDLIKNGGDDDDEGEEEEESPPEDMINMTHDEQQRALWLRASWICGIGTFLVVLFSDPMVDVLNELGTRTNIPQFYVAFVLAPLASNASEVIASYNYAQKKTSKSMAISLSALQGACCMNNTFVLGIFMICVYTQNLAWQFFAETASILVSVVFISLMSLKSTHTMFDALLILMVYPMSLALVYFLEASGWD